MFEFLKVRNKQKLTGTFQSLLKVRQFAKNGVATPGKLIPGIKSKEEKQYEVFLQDSPSWWTITAARLLDEEFFPLKDRQRYFLDDGVVEIGSVMTNQKIMLPTSEGFVSFRVNEKGQTYSLISNKF